jgi:hypothetical protein
VHVLSFIALSKMKPKNFSSQKVSPSGTTVDHSSSPPQLAHAAASVAAPLSWTSIVQLGFPMTGIPWRSMIHGRGKQWTDLRPLCSQRLAGSRRAGVANGHPPPKKTPRLGGMVSF